jgi:S1-C subfamily serine protease
VVLALALLAAAGLLRAYPFTLPRFVRESRELAADPVIREAGRAVVHVRALPEGTGPERRGSGFNVDESGLVVTNRHIIDGAAAVIVTFLDGRSLPASTWLIHPSADLALLGLEGSSLPTATLSVDPPSPGEDVFIVGNPLDSRGSVVRGTLSSTVTARDFPVVVIETSVYPGSSGSPVFAHDGTVVGVIFASRSEPVAGLAVPVVCVWDLLEMWDAQ